MGYLYCSDGDPEHPDRRGRRVSRARHPAVHGAAAPVHLPHHLHAALQDWYVCVPLHSPRQYFLALYYSLCILFPEFELNIAVIFDDDYLVTENFPILLLRSK